MPGTKEEYGFPERLLVTTYEGENDRSAWEAFETKEGVMARCLESEEQEEWVAVYKLVSLHKLTVKADLSDPTVVFE
jgi:hypothetical protein